MAKITYSIIQAFVKLAYPLFGWTSRLLSLKMTFYSLWACHRYGFRNVYFQHPVSFVIHPENMKIGKGTYFGSHAVVATWPEYRGQKFEPRLTIGQKCSFGANVNINCAGNITIGDNVLTGKWVSIIDNSHGTTDKESLLQAPSLRPLFIKGDITIGDRVWIGDKVSILSGVTIGEGAVIGANAVVTHDIPPFCTAVGNPARIIRNPEL